MAYSESKNIGSLTVNTLTGKILSYDKYIPGILNISENELNENPIHSFIPEMEDFADIYNDIKVGDDVMRFFSKASQETPNDVHDFRATLTYSNPDHLTTWITSITQEIKQTKSELQTHQQSLYKGLTGNGTLMWTADKHLRITSAVFLNNRNNIQTIVPDVQKHLADLVCQSISSYNRLPIEVGSEITTYLGGAEIPVNFRIRPLTDHYGETIGCLGICSHVRTDNTLLDLISIFDNYCPN